MFYLYDGIRNPRVGAMLALSLIDVFHLVFPQGRFLLSHSDVAVGAGGACPLQFYTIIWF